MLTSIIRSASAIDLSPYGQLSHSNRIIKIESFWKPGTPKMFSVLDLRWNCLKNVIASNGIPKVVRVEFRRNVFRFVVVALPSFR